MVNTFMKVACKYQHAQIEFNLDLGSTSTDRLDRQIQAQCPVCRLQHDVKRLESMLQTEFDARLKTNSRIAEMKGTMHELQAMLNWWQTTCAVDDALKKDDG